MIVQSYQKKDRVIINEVIMDKGSVIDYFHQLPILSLYLRNAPDDSEAAKVYSELPSVAHDYAFECSNQCQNIFKKEGRAVTVSNKLYVVKSCVPLKRIGTDQLDLIERDAQVEVTITDDSYRITWIADDSTIGEEQLLIYKKNGCGKYINSLEHSEWKALPSSTKKKFRNLQKIMMKTTRLGHLN